MEKNQKGLTNNRFVQVILLSSVLLQIGIWVRNFAILLFVMDQTNNDPVAVSLISLAEFAPIFIFSIIGGTYADRWQPKKTMIWCDFLSAVSVFFVLLALIFGTWKAIFFVTILSAILSQFSQPSAMKLFKMHVPEEKIQIGMSMYQTISSIFVVIGPALGTFVYHQFGISVAVSIMGIAFLLSAFVLLYLPKDHYVEPTAPEFWRELKEGLTYVWQMPVLKTLGLNYLTAGFAVGIIQPLAVFIVIDRLELPKEFLQYLFMASGFGMLIGGGFVMWLSGRLAPWKILALGMLGATVSIAVIGFSTNTYLTVSMEFLHGFFFPCIPIAINTLILKVTDQLYVGRVNGVLNPLFMGTTVIMMSISGWLKNHFSILTLYEVAAFFFMLGLIEVLPLFRLMKNKGQTNHV